MIRFDENFVYVCAPSSYKTYLSDVLSGTWLNGKKEHRFPKNVHVLRELIKAFPQLQNDLSFIAEGKALAEIEVKALYLKGLEDVSGNPDLRPYQRVDVQFLQQINGLIANEQRTGKTPIAIQLFRDTNIVVTPASLVWNWSKEILTWHYGKISCYVLHGTKAKKEKIFQEYRKSATPKVLIVSKDTLKGFPEIQKIRFDCSFVDEAHFLRNYKTAQSKAVYKILAKKRYALTGTPAVKHAVDVWGILHYLEPRRFPGYWTFAERYFTTFEDFMGHMKIGAAKKHREKELTSTLAMLSVERKRRDVMKWLPAKMYQTIPVQMAGKQVKFYERMVKEFIAIDDTSGHTVDTASVLAQLMRLRQLCLDPRLLGFDVVGAKTEALLDYLEDKHEPVVIMSQFTSYLKLLQKELTGRRVGMIHGEMDGKRKQSVADAFQKGEIDVLLCNIISAGTGFTLDRSDTVIFTDKAWNPSENEQAEDRIVPTTEQKNYGTSTAVITFTCRKSVDERIDELLQQKTSLTAIVNQNKWRELL